MQNIDIRKSFGPLELGHAIQLFLCWRTCNFLEKAVEYEYQNISIPYALLAVAAAADSKLS